MLFLMRWAVRLLIFRLLKMLVPVAGIFAVFGIGWDQVRDAHNVAADDPAYAVELFAPVAPVAKVLASRKFHHWGQSLREGWLNWDCTYAIVRLGQGAPVAPVTVARADMRAQYRFGGDWKATPADTPDGDARDAVAFCSRYWPEDVAAQMRQILSEPGHWVVADRIGETIFLYSSTKRLAARVRYGE